MKKIWLFLGVLIVGLFLVACASEPGEETNYAGEAISTSRIIGCNDTDGGKVPEVLGRLQVKYADGTIKGLVDQCKSAKILYERFCTGINPGIMNVQCPNGCNRGICKSDLTTCTPRAAGPCLTGVSCPGNVVVPATCSTPCQNGVCVATPINNNTG